MTRDLIRLLLFLSDPFSGFPIDVYVAYHCFVNFELHILSVTHGTQEVDTIGIFKAVILKMCMATDGITSKLQWRESEQSEDKILLSFIWSTVNLNCHR